MANLVVRLGSGCISNFPNGDPGEFLGIDGGGNLAWLTTGGGADGNELTEFGTVAGNVPISPAAPVTPPATPTLGDNFVETYDDAILFWEYNGVSWDLQTTIDKSHPYRIVFTVGGDQYEATAGETLTYRNPDAFTLTSIMASLATAGSTDTDASVTVNGAPAATVTIDATEKTSTTSATPATVVLANVPFDAEIIVTVDTPGTGALGLTITLIGLV